MLSYFDQCLLARNKKKVLQKADCITSGKLLINPLIFSKIKLSLNKKYSLKKIFEVYLDFEIKLEN